MVRVVEKEGALDTIYTRASDLQTSDTSYETYYRKKLHQHLSALLGELWMSSLLSVCCAYYLEFPQSVLLLLLRGCCA